MLPPAPGLFSMMNCWPSESDSFWASNRASTSVVPPGAKGTTTLTGFEG